MTDLTFVIPVYNREDYLTECLNSVLSLQDVNFDIVRIKANLQLQNKLSCNEKHAAPHRDFDFGHHVFLYYKDFVS